MEKMFESNCPINFLSNQSRRQMQLCLQNFSSGCDVMVLECEKVEKVGSSILILNFKPALKSTLNFRGIFAPKTVSMSLPITLEKYYSFTFRFNKFFVWREDTYFFFFCSFLCCSLRRSKCTCTRNKKKERKLWASSCTHFISASDSLVLIYINLSTHKSYRRNTI